MKKRYLFYFIISGIILGFFFGSVIGHIVKAEENKDFDFYNYINTKTSINLKDNSTGININVDKIFYKIDDNITKFNFSFNMLSNKKMDLEIKIDTDNCKSFFYDEYGYIFHFEKYNIIFSYEDIKNKMKIDLKCKIKNGDIYLYNTGNLKNGYYLIDPYFGFTNPVYDGRITVNNMIRSHNVTTLQEDGILNYTQVWLALNVPIIPPPVYRLIRSAVYDVTNGVDNAVLVARSEEYRVGGLSINPVRRILYYNNTYDLRLYKDHKYVSCIWASLTNGVAVYYDTGVTSWISHNKTRTYGQYPLNLDFDNITGFLYDIFSYYTIPVEEEDNIEKFLNEGILELNANVVILLLYFFFIIVAEWKKDYFYFIVCAVISMVYGFLLINDNNYNDFFGVLVMLGSIYYSYLALIYGLEYYNRFKK